MMTNRPRSVTKLIPPVRQHLKQKHSIVADLERSCGQDIQSILQMLIRSALQMMPCSLFMHIFSYLHFVYNEDATTDRGPRT